MNKKLASRFAFALKGLKRPKGKQLKFVRTHYCAKGRVATAALLAEKVGYKHHGGVNLQYGLLAKKIGKNMGFNDANLSLLVDFVRPRTVTNREWLLIMRPEFADGLRQAGWVKH